MAPLRSLYICYLPLSEPLVETQVLSYLIGLAAAGHEINLLTFEDRKHDGNARAEIRQRLAAQGVTWHSLRYHKWPSLPATAFDVLAGIVKGLVLVWSRGIDVVHVRNPVPGAMGLAIRKLSRCSLLFDIRGLMAEEYADAGIWTRGSFAFRITKKVEARCIAVADGVVILTDRARELLFGSSTTTASGAPVTVIPSCVNVQRIQAQRGRRDEVRSQLRLENCLVLTYVGKFSTWYMAHEMAAFFARLRSAVPRARFLVLTQSDPHLIQAEFAALGISPDDWRVISCPPEEVGAYLSASDCGISMISRLPSKAASSPTKVGEYLAAGLPIVMTAGIGDGDNILTATKTSVIVESHTRDSYTSALRSMEALVEDIGTAGRCVAAAEKYFSLTEVGIPRYLHTYEQVAARRYLKRAQR